MLIETVKACYEELLIKNLVAAHTRALIMSLREHPDIQALKGCGAMGADTVLVLVKKACLHEVRGWLEERRYRVMASAEDVWQWSSLTCSSQ